MKPIIPATILYAELYHHDVVTGVNVFPVTVGIQGSAQVFKIFIVMISLHTFLPYDAVAEPQYMTCDDPDMAN